MITLVIATRNAHKVAEIRAILGESLHYLTLKDFPDAPEVVEDAATFAGNAMKKAIALARWLAEAPNANLQPSTFNFQLSTLFVLADDSGLEVDALGGAPGVHSARFAAQDTGRAGNSEPAENNAKLLRLLKDLPPAKRTARFHCIAALTPVLKRGRESASPVCYVDGL
jgi:XTP/dITP diphosphohydrolase